MPKRTLRGAVLVEGKYDASKLANLVDGLILISGGFDIYADKEKREFLRRIAREQGLTILTDSDRAGFQIRNYVMNFCGEEYVRQAFIPARPGKERRKALPGKEGLLGVEGVSDADILRALENAGALLPEAGQAPAPEKPTAAQQPVTYYDLYEWGLSGGEGSSERRRAFLQALDLPPRLSKKALVEVLNTLYTRSQLEETLQKLSLTEPQKP